jgi:hypothetical protein
LRYLNRKRGGGGSLGRELYACCTMADELDWTISARWPNHCQSDYIARADASVQLQLHTFRMHVAIAVKWRALRHV